MAKNLSWKFPLRNFVFLKIETLLVAVLALIAFFTVFFQADQGWVSSVVLAVAFIVVYVGLSYMIQWIRGVEEKYNITATHFEVTRKTKRKVKKVKIPLKQIVHHKLDKFFLGGYLLTATGEKHLLFFNSRAEAEQFEKMMEKRKK